MLLEYTEKEGGTFYKMCVHESVEETIKRLRRNRFILPYFDGPPERTVLQNKTIHTVKFPDGTLWNAYYAYFLEDPLHVT